MSPSGRPAAVQSRTWRAKVLAPMWRRSPRSWRSRAPGRPRPGRGAGRASRGCRRGPGWSSCRRARSAGAAQAGDAAATPHSVLAASSAGTRPDLLDRGMSCPSCHSGVTKAPLTVSLARAVPSRRARVTFTSARDDHLCARSQVGHVWHAGRHRRPSCRRPTYLYGRCSPYAGARHTQGRSTGTGSGPVLGPHRPPRRPIRAPPRRGTRPDGPGTRRPAHVRMAGDPIGLSTPGGLWGPVIGVRHGRDRPARAPRAADTPLSARTRPDFRYLLRTEGRVLG